MSILTIVLCIVFYFWAPSDIVSTAIYIIFLLTSTISALLVINSNGIESPFFVFWILICIFSGIFGALGSLPIFIASCAFIAAKYIEGGLNNTALTISLITSILPIIIGLLIWRGKSSQSEDDDNKSYKNLADELNAVASKSDVVINAIGDGVIVIDAQGIIQLINPAAQNLIGWSKKDALALDYKSILKLVDQKDTVIDTVSDPIKQVLNGNQEVRTNKLSLMTSSDKKIMISLLVSPVGDTGSGAIIVFRDITKEIIEEREQAEFISTASHEMRTPVASIEGYLGLALNPQTAQIDERARNFILKAHDSAAHLGRLFQDLLDIAKSEDGRLSNKPKVINIVIFLRDVVQGLAEKANNKGLRLIYKPMPDNTNEKHIAPVYSVNLDNDHIREIINNLIENAIKYTSKGEIIIDIEGDDERVIISIQDNGIGIPAEDIPHLFQKFYRVENQETNDIGGTGLGLYLCRKLAEIMGGRIWVESVYGKGSKFFLELPRIDNKEAKLLAEQELINQQSAIVDKPMVETTFEPDASIITAAVTPNIEPAVNESATTTIQSPHSVPRGQALTPEQIAAYVVKQRELARKQAVEQLSQPKTIPVQNREDIK